MAEEKKKPGRPAGSKNKKTTTKKSTGSSRASKNSAAKNATGSRVKDEIFSIIIIAVGIFFAVAMQTSAAGEFGTVIRNFFLGCFGAVAMVFPYYLILYGVLLMTKKTTHINKRSAILLFITFLMFAIINSGRFIETEKISFAYFDFLGWFDQGVKMTSGGVLGMMFAVIIMVAVGEVGLYIFAVLVIIVCLMLIINTPISQFVDDFKTKRAVRKMLEEEAAEAEAQLAEERHKQLEMDLKQAYADKARAASVKEEIAPIVKKARDNEKKKNILGYMKDDLLFKSKHEHTEPVQDEPADKPAEEAAEENVHEKTEPDIMISYGLEEITPVREGYGLCEKTTASVASFMAPEGAKPAPGTDRFIKASSEKVNKVEGQPTEGVQEQMQMKLTKQEAANARLTAEDFNKTAEAMAKYEFPSIDLLNKNKANRNTPEMESALKAKAAKLEKTLQDFKVDAKVVQVTQGPAVTRYEIQPSTGVKVSSIVRLADDIALNLEAKSIRMEAPIPGKAAVGIEVENEKINMVTVREIIDSAEFRASKSKITFAVGKDIAGKAIVADLKTMPHLLIAGSTGSGKSVCINSIIVSILYKAKPDEVKFVLIDPKVVELGNYNGIPHMLIPVVTEPSKAAAALNWAVAEMTDRYKKFAEESVRDLEGYNQLVRSRDEQDKVLPQIVIIIDELADLMMAAPSQVEESICRLAQMARAAGMHLIVATQRPSVDVITGVIKANIPSRIAFAVSSQFDSRTILDMGGAEKLVGKGDMLFNPLGSGKPVRVQGTFISDSEVHNVIEHLKKQCVQNEYPNEIMNTIESNAGIKTASADNDGDELLPEAIETVVRAEQASVSMLQRRFRIGYNRAARIIDMMEARGIIGPADGSRPRQVLMSLDEFLGIQSEGEEVLKGEENKDEEQAEVQKDVFEQTEE